MTIKVSNAQKQSIEIGVKNTPTQKVNIEQDVILVPVYKDVPLYEGEYIVTPKIEEQIIPTKDKVLAEDMTIKSIPIYRVTNQTGGTTIYIAKEI